jgi:hypothetical protein
MPALLPAPRPRRRVLAVACVAALVASSACSMQSYRADPYPDAAAATLTVIEYGQCGAVWNAVIKDVDGKPPPYLFRETQKMRSSLLGGGTEPGKSIALTPGEHDLRVGIYWNSFPDSSRGNPFYGDCHLDFVAASGGVYRLHSDYSRDPNGDFADQGATWNAWIIDESTDTVANTNPCRPSAF